MNRFLFGCLLLISFHTVYAEGLIGIDTLISGVEERAENDVGEEASAGAIGGIADSLGDAIYEAGVQTRRNGIATNVVKPVVQVNDDGVVENSEGNQINAPVPQKKKARKKIIRLPKGVVTKESDKDGYIVITSEDKGTYAIETPPFLTNQVWFNNDDFSHYSPLDSRYVDIVKKGSKFFVTLKTSEAPVSVVFYSQRESSNSTSLVFLPNSNVINKTIKYKSIPDGTNPVEIVASKSELKKAMVFESSFSTDERIVNSHKLISGGSFPSGYELVEIEFGEAGFICGERRLVSKIVQKITGRKFVFEIYQVTNISEDYFEIDESKCLSDNVVSVQLNPGWTIAPSETKELVIQRRVAIPTKQKNIRNSVVKY